MAAFLTASLVLALLVSSFSVSAGQRITGEPGDNVTLTCRTDENKDVIVVQWNRTDLGSDQPVLRYRGKFCDSEIKPFKDRVDLLDMKKGNASLILKSVTTDDTGTYVCQAHYKGDEVQDTDPISTVYLIVKAKKCGGAGTKDANQGNTSRRRRSDQDTDPNCNIPGIKDGGMKTGLAVSHVGLLWFFLLLLL